MKLPDVFSGLLGKSEETKEYYFSLYLDADAAAVAVWSLSDGSPVVGSFAHAVVAEDSWEARTHVVDRLLSAAEDKVGVTKPIAKTVFGMPGAYLTDEGNIKDSVRPHLKKLSQMLELTPVGFVPLATAIAFSLKKDEGVPPSVILVGCSAHTAQVTLYRVGQITHDDVIDIREDPAQSLEAILKKHQDGDVLPSRMLLYGGNTSLLEEIRSKLLKHPWPTRTNFLHFPKIEFVTHESLLTSVSLAGASELAHDIGESAEATAATVVAQPGVPSVRPETEAEEEVPEEEEEGISASSPSEEPEDDSEREEEDESNVLEAEEAEEAEEEDDEDVVSGESGVVMTKNDADEIENIQMVTPESLGFKEGDMLEQGAPTTAPAGYPAPHPKGTAAPMHRKFAVPNVSLPALQDLSALIHRLPKLRGGLPLIIGGVLFVALLAGLYYAVPRATVTVLVASQSLDESTTLTVDTAATVTDSESKIIPGKEIEQSVSGEKTVAVSGKKNIGDPAKGSVTIYNKVTSGKTLPKGSTLTASGVSFTLDSDVTVASASETIGSITFGKATANVTAKDIGPNGNLAGGSEFTVANASSLSARNDTAFTGGTSKQVTVVSRSDQDNLVKALTEELVAKAKEQLKSQAAGSLLIDQTIKTEVTEKVFDAELDEEAKSLNGKVTISVSGTSVSDGDAKAALLPLIEKRVPTGYKLAPEQTSVTTSNVTVKKDGTITLSAKLTAIALPTIDGDTLRGRLAGQPVEKASAILKETQGVAGAEYNITLTPFTKRLPLNGKNITISVAVQ